MNLSSPHPNPLPKGEGIFIYLLSFFLIYPLSLWERAGVRAGVRVATVRENFNCIL